MKKIRRQKKMYSQLPLKRVYEPFVHFRWSRSGDNPPLGDSLSIVACRQLYNAMSPKATALSECITQNDPTVCIEVLEQEGIPKDWGIMLLPLIQQEMGGEQ